MKFKLSPDGSGAVTGKGGEVVARVSGVAEDDIRIDFARPVSPDELDAVVSALASPQQDGADDAKSSP